MEKQKLQKRLNDLQVLISTTMGGETYLRLLLEEYNNLIRRLALIEKKENQTS